ncbi:MAG TPA: VOC family protein [Ktedonobacteraceae bacterium]|nr:VOC family protein [Ktedonobacteraceae bacterium]
MTKTYTTKIGHAHLKVRNLDRSIEFYTRYLNMHETERVDNHYAFLTGGSFHHEIALQKVRSNAPQPPAHGTGLYHVAFEVPDRRSFAEAYRTLTQAGIPVAPVDHFISWAMYFDDPDGNGLEIYCDSRSMPDGRPLWNGENAPLNEETILAEINK